MSTEMLYIDPATCIDCGACMDACPVEAIVPDEELTESEQQYVAVNAEYFDKFPLQSAGTPPMSAPAVKVSHSGQPLRVAIVGSGPSACYAAEHLLETAKGSVEIDMFDRLPTPWGLIRSGVAPDHLRTKAVTDLFRSTVAKSAFRFHLNVEVGKHITHRELMSHHHAVIYAVGASTDHRLGVPGEELVGSHAATDIVAWYNGHPDYADLTFDLSKPRAVIIGNGNVALDVARILVSDPDDLARTDIADHALDALRRSNIREVVVIGRRGPAQAAFTSPELMALGQMRGVDVVVDPDDLTLDEHSKAAVDSVDTPLSTVLKTQILQEYGTRVSNPTNKRIILRFLASPIEINGVNHVESVQLVHNEICQADDNSLKARPTGRYETIETGLILRSIGYRGTEVSGVPFDHVRGVIPNEDGRVLDPDTGDSLAGIYATGWIKRGPSGFIGTNRKCAQDTVELIVEDFLAGKLRDPGPSCGRRSFHELVQDRQPEVVDHSGWQAIDKAERQRGREQKRPRRKFTDVQAMLDITREKPN